MSMSVCTGPIVAGSVAPSLLITYLHLMPYTEAVVYEALRMFPPGVLTPRISSADTTVTPEPAPPHWPQCYLSA